MPVEVALRVQDKLTGNDLIMLALCSKTLASRVEGLPVRKIANISGYTVSRTDPAVPLREKSVDEDWRKLGFLEKPASGYPWARQAAVEQQADLKTRVGQYLGQYAHCDECRKFRPLDQTFWREFAEHENPGITKASSKARPKIEEVFSSWEQQHRAGGYNPCPAHELLREDGGKRLLLSA